MNLKIKAIFTAVLLLTVLTFVAGCSAEKTPYEVNDSENYSVSVKFDAFGGIFTTNTSVIVDSYNISELPSNDGKVQIALISPDNPYRGNDAFTAVKNGYFLAGWYTERTETVGDDNKTEVVYSGRWDFDKDLLEVDTDKVYTASEPVLTLYAAWIPMFEIEFYDMVSGEYLESFTFNPTTQGDILTPGWNEQTGAIEMYDFPEKSGFTFSGAYFDAEGKQPVSTQTLTHPGQVDYTNGLAKNPVMKLYVDYVEGEWYHIYNVEQFLDNASVNGNYVIHKDLDFTGEIWPSSLMHGNFSGTIEGNGHVFQNITFEQTNNSKVNSGLFGHLTETARLTDLSFENVSFTIQSGTRVAGASFGLLAGTISDETVLENLHIADSMLKVDSSCYFGTEDYAIGLVCGMGNSTVDPSGIKCIAVGEDSDSISITVSGNEVTLIFEQ